jgi:hypothetical protein
MVLSFQKVEPTPIIYTIGRLSDDEEYVTDVRICLHVFFLQQPLTAENPGPAIAKAMAGRYPQRGFFNSGS